MANISNIKDRLDKIVLDLISMKVRKNGLNLKKTGMNLLNLGTIFLLYQMLLSCRDRILLILYGA